MPSIASTVLSGLSSGVLAGAGAAAAHVDRRDRGRIEDDRGDAGGERCVIGVADANAGNIGEEIFQGGGPSGRIWLGLPHGYNSRGRCFNCQAPAGSSRSAGPIVQRV